MPDDPMTAGRSAVLCIDLQDEYRGSGVYPVHRYDEVLAKAAAVVGVARRAGVPVIHVQAWVEEAERQGDPLRDETVAEELRSAVAGSAGAALCVEVAPVPGETVIRKRWPSAFRATPLTATLREAGVGRVLVLGVWTDSCVRASVFDAIAAGFRVWLVKDACGSGTETMHRAAVLDMANRLYGGSVLRTGEVLKALRGEPHAAWRCSRPVEFLYTLDTLDAHYDAL